MQPDHKPLQDQEMTKRIGRARPWTHAFGRDRAGAMTTRLHHLDAARAVLLLLGIPFHVATTATMILSPGFPGFVADPAVGIGLSFIHAFRMSAFFMLAGYFAGMASQRRGRHDWLADRLRRVALPLLASVFTLGLVQYRLKVALSPAWENGYRGVPVAFEHLWFLIVLLGYVFTYVLRPRVSRLSDRLWRPLLGLDPGTWPLALLALALWGGGVIALGIVCDLQDSEAVFEQQLLLRYLQYLPAFALGTLAWRLRLGDTLFNYRKAWPWLVTIPLLLGHFALDPLVRPHFGLEENPSPLLRVVDGAIAGALAYAMSLLVFRLLAHAFDRPNRIVSFLVDGAMAIYLFHLMVAMVLVLVMARLGWTDLPMPLLVWAGMCAVVLAGAVVCFLIVRRVPLLATLFGAAPPPKRARPEARNACNPPQNG